MRDVIAGTLVIALPGLVAIGLLAAPKPKAAAPVQIPITGQAQDAAGNRYTLSGALTLTTDTPLPTPDPVSIVSLTVSPQTVTAGQGTTGTVTLNRAPLQPVQIALKALDKGLTLDPALTINVGQTAGTFAIGTPAAQTTAYWYSLQATYNGQSKSGSLLVMPNATPAPVPVPGSPSPRVEALTAPDGTPLVLPGAPGQRVRVVGEGFGAEAGELWWNGAPMQIGSWSDTEALGRLPRPSGVTAGVEVRTKAGGFWGGMLAPDEPWAEAPGPEPPASRR